MMSTVPSTPAPCLDRLPGPTGRPRRLAAALLGLGLCAGAGAAAACTPDYLIVRGDTLSGIAYANLGSVFDYPRIHDRNRDVIGDDPDMIYAGDRLDIPCDFAELEEIDWSVMPDPEDVAALMDQMPIQVIDIRGAKALAKGVVPGAVSVPYSLWRGPKENPGRPPSEADLEALLSIAGLDLDAPILVVHDKDNPMSTGRAARVYWLLKSSGASQLAILRGGFKGWTAAGLPVADRPVAARTTDVDVAFSDDWHAETTDVIGIALGQVDGHLLDARPHGMFAKLDDLGRALATTLPGAQSAPAPALMSTLAGEIDIEAGAYRVIDYLVEHDVDYAAGNVVSFCHTGELGALNWFYASELAGLPGMKLYPDSIKGWTSRGGDLVPGAPSDG